MIAMITGILFMNLPSVGPVAATGDPSKIMILSSESKVSVKAIEEPGKELQGKIADSENTNLELRIDVRVENLPPRIGITLPEFAHLWEPLLAVIDISDPNTRADIEMATLMLYRDGLPILELDTEAPNTGNFGSSDIDVLSTQISQDGIVLRLNSIQPGTYRICVEAEDESYSTLKILEFQLE